MELTRGGGDETNGSLGGGLKQQQAYESELLTPKEAAAFLKMSASFLAKARMRGDGPRYRKLSRSVRYEKADLIFWLKASAKTSTSEREEIGRLEDRKE